MTSEARVGIFWFVQGRLVATGCPLADATAYGDCLTYDGGHDETWTLWREAGASWLVRASLPLLILSSEYDDHPRGRVVRQPERFVIYADRRIQYDQALAEVRAAFCLPAQTTVVRSDAHYRATSRDGA